MLEKVLETRTCSHCSSKFDITDIDQSFLTRLIPTIGGKKFELPFPTYCPKCRKMRRYAWRNEKNIYKRKCDATGKTLISLFSADAHCPVYESDYWYSDKWDAHQYGREYDFSRSFFEQWGELQKLVPMPGKSISRIMENSDYSDNCSGLKNCYLCFNTGDSEDCMYDIDMWNSEDCIDCISINNCHECYELIDSRNCYSVHFSFDVKNSYDSYFLYDCDGCRNCYGCHGLKNAEFHIYNTPFSKEEYTEKIKKLTTSPLTKQKETVGLFLQKSGYIGYIPKNTGSEKTFFSSRVFDSKNISFSHMLNKCEDIRYGKGLRTTKLTMDCDNWGDDLEKSYENLVIGENAYSIYFSIYVWANISNLYYSIYCVNNVMNCFGCIGLRNAEYCILNKQYTKEEYEKLVPKIIENMKRDGEWGEFFPAIYSHFGYNQTMNMAKYPLTKDEALKSGFTWSDYEAPFPKVAKTIPGSRLPENIDEVPDDILSWAIECEVTKKPFRIVKSELEFYRKHHLPIPRKHPDERYRERTKIYLNY